ncbi:hypothetical protein ACFO5X_23960 [Seohaeicola nanhaiensis]|uniref:DUF4136 domain-containing protein n=1 Tax=Seohaeicola nanhaiensis TaxID=1387282 RepID=A0ABV9KNN5_9RHOB
MTRILSLLTALLMIAACTPAATPEDPLADLGAFRLGYNVVIADKMKKGPVSRDATKEEWEGVLKNAVAQRFGRYQGNQLYHFGISVEGYMLAPPGVPLIYKPKSALILNVTIWDDAANAKLNPEVKQFTVFESTTSGTFLVGSGNERTKEEQMAGLAANAVREIEKWMVEQKTEKGWFMPRAGAATEARVPSALAAPVTE